MKKEDLRIVFMGTPAFAVASLEALINDGFNVVAVITAPDKPAGRGMQLKQSEVKQYAQLKGIPVLQPEKLKDPSFIENLKSFNAHLQIVVAFRMLPEIVWNMPPLGTINVHGSLLPQYRGAAPINWAVINGEKITGVTTFKLKHEIDTGDILLQESFPILENDDAGSVHDKMKVIGANLLVKTLYGLLDESIQEKPQIIDGKIIRHAPKIFTDTCKIDFSKSVDEVHQLIRGLSPFPGAFTYLNNKMLKIFNAEKVIDPQIAEPPFSIKTDQKSYLKFACANGWIDVKMLQLEGKKKMQVDEFLRGNRIQIT